MEINELSVQLHLISQAELFTIKGQRILIQLLTWAISLMRLHFLKRYLCNWTHANASLSDFYHDRIYFKINGIYR